MLKLQYTYKCDVCEDVYKSSDFLIMYGDPIPQYDKPYSVLHLFMCDRCRGKLELAVNQAWCELEHGR